MRRLLAILILLVVPTGCVSDLRSVDPTRQVVFVHGAAGDGPWYAELRQGVKDGSGREAVTFGWGMRGPMIFANFSSRSVHERAEHRLAALLVATRAEHPATPVDLVAHSAGCGVVLGALAALPEGVRVGRVVLLAPSVSPGYDLAPSLDRAERIVVFHSDRDVTFLKWRCSTFGTYDRVKTAAAGHTGFDVARLDAARAARLRQVAYEERFAELGHDGEHFGMVARRFVAAHVAGLLAEDADDAGDESP